MICPAVPLLAATCSAQLLIVAQAISPRHAPAVYPLIAQLTGWSAVTIAVAVCTGRSRYADLGGAIAAPIGLGAIAVTWYAPIMSGFLAEPPAAPHELTIAWSAIATSATALTCAAMRDQWHRYARASRRLQRFHDHGSLEPIVPGYDP